MQAFGNSCGVNVFEMPPFNSVCALYRAWALLPMLIYDFVQNFAMIFIWNGRLRLFLQLLKRYELSGLFILEPPHHFPAQRARLILTDRTDPSRKGALKLKG